MATCLISFIKPTGQQQPTEMTTTTQGGYDKIIVNYLI